MPEGGDEASLSGAFTRGEEDMTPLHFRTPLRAVLAAAVLLSPSLAHAHTGLGVHGSLDGFSHPFLGLDHFLAMTAVGFWAAALGGRARLIVPAAFLLLMAAGGALGMSGVALPAVEQGIAASVILLGLAIAAQLRVPTGLAAGLVAVFAVFHGQAHGAEWPATASAAGYVAGFLSATALLHGLGLALGALPLPVLAQRLIGGGVAGAGLALAYAL